MHAVNIMRKKLKVWMMANQGYSLIQMALALMVIGIIAVMFIRVYEMYNATEQSIKTQENVSIAINAIHTYRQTFGHYPCPAPINANRTLMNAVPLPAYGRASDYNRYLPTGTTPLAIGDCGEGICIEATNRPPIGNIRVRVGGIPFRDMQLDEDKIVDGYGSRLWYAVTEDQCNLATFNDTRGGIRIINDRGEDQTNPPGSASYVVISPGQNKAGGYGKLGQLQAPCPDIAVPEGQNCRDVTVAQADTTATYRSQFTTDASDATTFDDVVEFFSSSVNQLWRRTTTTSEDIVDVANANVGIGKTNPGATLDISQSSVNTTSGQMATLNQVASNVQHGGLRVNTAVGNGLPNSKLYAATYCNETGANCFKTSNIMGKNSDGTGGMVCPPDQYPVGIQSSGSDARFVCVDNISIKCPVGKVFAGFDVVGGTRKPKCTDSNLYVSCPATKISLCAADDIDLPPAVHGDETWPYVRGSCRTMSYRCNNGTWLPIDQGGSCTNNVIGPPEVFSCGTCWSGTYTRTPRECVSDNDQATQCRCQASSSCYTETQATCPANEPSGTGAITRHYKVCDPSNPYAEAFVPPGDPGTITTPQTCACTKQSKNVFSACSTPGQIRTSTPALTNAADTSTNSWPSDINLGIAQHVTVDANCEYQNSGAPINACGCNTADRYTGVIATTPSCKKIKSGSRSFGGTSFAWNYDVMKSVVTNAATCQFSAPTLHDAAQFDELTPYWREQPGGAIDFNKPESSTSTRVDDSCSCVPYLNTTRNCRKGNSTGSWDIYDCKCTGS